MKKFYQHVPADVSKTDINNYRQVHCYYDDETNSVFIQKYGKLPNLTGYYSFKTFYHYIEIFKLHDDFMKSADFTAMPNELSAMFKH